jgi:putative membrane protein
VHAHHGHAGFDPGLPLALLLGTAAVLYLAAAASQQRAGRRPWPARRVISWLLGITTIAAAVIGPLADAAQHDFAAHMAAHLLLGMLAPLLLALSAPITLALRTLDVRSARRLSRFLHLPIARFLTHPAPAALINAGSLWALYATPLSTATLGDPLLHHLVLAHLFLAGYLFTVSIIGIDPAPHRASFRLRLVVLVLAIAAHSILAKHIFSHPPGRTSPAQAEQGAMLMYYGGDLLELALVMLFCAQWYRAARPAAAQLTATRKPVGRDRDVHRSRT